MEESQNRPPLYEIDEDSALIVPQYDKEYPTSFEYDMEHLHYKVFYQRISSLKGDFKDVLSLRDRYMRGQKMEPEERKAAVKVLTKEQEAFTTWKIKQQEGHNMDSTRDALVESLMIDE